MPVDDEANPGFDSADLTESLIRFALIAILALLSLRVLAPFADVVLLALILATTLYPWHLALTRRLGGRQGLAATVLVVSGLLLLGVPATLLGGSLAGQAQRAYAAIHSTSVAFELPDVALADWPLVGERLQVAWDQATEDFPAYLQDHRAQIRDLSFRALSVVRNAVVVVLMFLGALVIAGVMMVYGESGSAAIGRTLSRLSDPGRGLRLQRLATAAVRSVAAGVVGVAFIQALLLGVGFLLAGVPAPGLLSLIAVVLGILQLPGLLIALPVIGYVWWAGDSSAIVNAALTVYLLLASMSDNVLKPLLLGRGVDAPMPLILLGALGGMFTSGILGLFTGPVVLVVSYEIFMHWVGAGSAHGVAPATAGPGTEQMAPTTRS